jgi:hypothetical protein
MDSKTNGVKTKTTVKDYLPLPPCGVVERLLQLDHVACGEGELVGFGLGIRRGGFHR